MTQQQQQQQLWMHNAEQQLHVGLREKKTSNATALENLGSSAPHHEPPENASYVSL
jgi:hypothetical protein